METYVKLFDVTLLPYLRPEVFNADLERHVQGAQRLLHLVVVPGLRQQHGPQGLEGINPHLFLKKNEKECHIF